MAYDAAQKWVMWVGLLGAAACGYLGYPCAVAFEIEAAIRSTCMAYCLCQALPLLLGPGDVSKGLLRLGLFSQTAALWLGSRYWPLGKLEGLKALESEVYGLWRVVLAPSHRAYRASFRRDSPLGASGGSPTWVSHKFWTFGA